jgi:hypothetical protein
MQPFTIAAAKPDPRYRVTRIGAGHEGDLAAELEAAEDAGYTPDRNPIVLANGDLLVVSAKERASNASARAERRFGVSTRRHAHVPVATERRVGKPDRRASIGAGL